MKKLLIICLCFVSISLLGQSVDGSLKTLTATGTNTYVISEPVPLSYDPKERFLVRFTNGNTGASTLNRATLGPKAIQKAGAIALSSGDIVAGGTYLLSYNGTYYQIVGDGSGGGGAGGGSFTVASLAEAQAGTDNTKVMTPLRISEVTKDKSIGSIYNKNSWANLNDWDVNGTSPTVSSGEIVFSNSLTYDHYLTLKTSVANTTVRENWYMSTIFTNNTGGQGGYLGVRSVALYNRSLIGFWNANTLGIQASSGTFATLNTATLNASVGDRIFIDVRRQGNRVIVTGRNLTTGAASVTVSYTFNSGTVIPTFTTPNTSRFCIGSFGNVTFSNLAITSTDQQGADIALIGDSITSLYSATDFTKTFANLLRRTYDVVTFAGPSDSSTDALTRLQEVIDSKPKNVIVFCWINDPGLGISTATTTANIDAIYTALNAAGINVLFMQYYSTAVSLTAIETHLTTNYPTRIIDPKPLMNANSLIADGVHMNDQGNEIYAQAIKASGKIIVGKNYGGLKSTLDNTFMAVGGTVLNSTNTAIPYFDQNNALAQDATNFVFDYTNKRLGIGTNSPTFTQDIRSADYYQQFIKGTSASTISGIVLENNRSATNNAVVSIRGSSVAASVFGGSFPDWFVMASYGANSAGMAIGSINSAPVNFYSNNTERLSISSSGAFGLSGANFGTSGQVLTSQGSASAPIWSTVLTNPMTTLGDLILGGASGTPTRLAIGSSGLILKSNGTTAGWGSVQDLLDVTSVSVRTSSLVGVGGNSGTVTVRSGNTDSGNTGLVTIATGDNTISGTIGSIDILTGTPTGGTQGSVNVQKNASGRISFFNASPVVKQSAVTSSQGIADVLTAYGLLPTSTISGGGSGISGLTSGRVTFATSGTTIGDDSNLVWNNTNKALSVGGGGAIGSSVSLDIQGTTKAFKMGTATLASITTPVNGMLTTDTNVPYFHNGTSWDVILRSSAPTITGTNITTTDAAFDVFNTTATTINAFGAATTLNLGASTGILNLRNATLTAANATSFAMNGASPSITTTSTGTASVFNTAALTGNLFGAATTIGIGNTATAAQTVNMFTASTGASTYNFGTGATSSGFSKNINIGTAGTSGSVTTTIIGSSVSGAISSVSLRGTTTITETVRSTSGTTFSVTQGAHTGGTQNLMTVSGGTGMTGLIASTEAIDVDFALNRTVQFSTGALATQRAVLFRAPTYGFVGASTITNAATVAITGAPTAGTNATITNPWALRIEAGNSQTFGKWVYDATETAGGTTGAQTINKPSGSVNFAAGATSLVVTNSFATTTSHIFCTIETNDATATIKNVVRAAGSFTINLGAAATAETRVAFLVIN